MVDGNPDTRIHPAYFISHIVFDRLGRKKKIEKKNGYADDIGNV